jgi:hypothetical protein
MLPLILPPILMLPSTLALAFPDENPNLYRTGGSLVPVFLMVGVAVDGLMTTLQEKFSPHRGLQAAWALALVLLLLNSVQDYDLVFRQYSEQYRRSAQNSSEMGQAVSGFIELYNRPDNVWVMGFPNWVDTRLVAIVAGYPGKDYEMFVQHDNPQRRLDYTLGVSGPKLFIVNVDDTDAQAALKNFYPQGRFERHISPLSEYNKDFLIFLVLPPEDQNDHI